MSFENSAGIVSALLKQLGFEEEFPAIIKIWEKELGTLSKHAKISGIKKGLLFVDVSSSAHMQELAARKRDVIARINQHFGGKKVVKNIKFELK
jgi:predicted nucleic acid-binding Zn ribbon protein